MQKRALAVIVWPVGLVIGLPWLLSVVFFGWSSIGGMLMLAKNVIFIRWAAQKLSDEFRAVAPLTVGDWFKQPEEFLDQMPHSLTRGLDLSDPSKTVSPPESHIIVSPR